MKLKKLLAGAMAAVLTLGSVTVLADTTNGSLGGDNSGNGQGEFEGYVSEENYSFTLPTIASTGGFDFILDPQGLVATASGTATTFASASSYTTGSMYFKNVSGSTYTYGQKSDAMTITNNGSVDIDITVKATVTPNNKLASGASVAFTTGSSFASDAGASVYLALTDNTTTVAIANASGSSYTATMTKTELAGSPNAYGIFATGDSYEYKLKDASYASFASYSFYLTGASGGDWSKLATNTGDKIFDISVVWDVKQHEDTPPAPIKPTASATSIKNNGGTVDITYPAGVTIKEVQRQKSDGSYVTIDTSYYGLTDITNGQKITLKDILGTYTTCANIKIIFSSGDPITLSITK